MQLKMIFDRRRSTFPESPFLPQEYRLRIWKETDRLKYLELRECCGFSNVRAEKELSDALSNLRRGGFLLIEETATGRLAASAMSRLGYYLDYDNLSWVMTHPDFRGHSLGRFVCTEALRISLSSGAAGMTLATDDFREAALRMYLKLGWRPWLYTMEDNMRERWEAISRKFNLAAAAEFKDFQGDRKWA